MNNIVETFSELGNTTVDQVAEVQSRMLEWNRQVAETVVPQFAAVPGAQVFAGGQNIASDIIEASFALTTKALAANKAFATGLLEAWTPKSTD